MPAEHISNGGTCNCITASNTKWEVQEAQELNSHLRADALEEKDQIRIRRNIHKIARPGRGSH